MKVLKTGSILNPLDIVGKPEDEAKKMCESLGYSMRVISKDGQAYCVTCDVRSNRVNVSVADGKILVVNNIG